MTEFVPSKVLASLLGITDRAIELAITRACNRGDMKWRGATLVVREVHGRGGRSGTSYQVSVDSLPADLQECLKTLRSPAEGRLNHGTRAQIERDWLHAVIAPALTHPKGSAERAAAVREIAGRRHMRPDGERKTFSERSILRRLKDYEEAGGLGGLGRTKRRDAGTARVFVTRAWDAAVPFDETSKERIGRDLRQYIRGLVQAGEAPSNIRLLAARKLTNLTVAAGFSPDQVVRERICHIPKGHVDREAIHRKVRIFDADRKAHEDAKPRIRRTRSGLFPMDVVVGDVHPIDILIRRDDGSTITPKAIAWLDLATNRVWLDPLLLEKGDGIRNADVIASFARMVRAWGAPRALYLDNGSEYNWAEFVDDALKLIDREGRRTLGTIAPWAERTSNIIRAKPYNAAAKPIEGIFSVLERTVFHTIPGWIGGDRMKKKTANVGRDPDPYPGAFDDLREEITRALALYEIRPQRGALAGKSPITVWNEAIAAGWGATAVDQKALLIAFSDAKEKTVSQGTITHKGRRYTCRELLAFHGDKVTALIPKYGEWSAIPLKDRNGTIIGFAEEDRPFALLDPEGAREAERRSTEKKRAIRDLRRSVPAVDPRVERAALVSDLPAIAPPPVAAVIGLTDETARIAERITETTAERAERKTRDAAAEQDRIDEENRYNNEITKKIAAAMRGRG